MSDEEFERKLLERLHGVTAASERNYKLIEELAKQLTALQLRQDDLYGEGLAIKKLLGPEWCSKLEAFMNK